MNAREYLQILHIAERLKDTPRHCTTSNRRTESVAEHSWRISLMAFLLRGEFPQADIDKVIKMCLIHDLGECFTGDIPAFSKTDGDREIEDRLLNDWVKSLPEEVSNEMAALYAEMDEQKTLEAKLYKSLDKLEALIQHNESPIDTWAENEYELNKTYAVDTVSFSPWLTELRKAILEDTLEKIETEGKRQVAVEAGAVRIADEDILIRDFTEGDLPLMLKWLTDERVLEFYEGRDADYTPETLEEDYLEELPGGFRMIFEYAGKPIGYGQAYRLAGDMFEEYDYPDTGRAVYAMDQFIGEPEYWNRGIGTAIIKLISRYLKERFAAEIILLDPHKSNPRAIGAYEKAGFGIVKSLPAHELFEGKKEDCWLMEKRL